MDRTRRRARRSCDCARRAVEVDRPFIGSEALARGVMNRHRLRTQDSLSRATGLEVGNVAAIARRHPGIRGLRSLEAALELVDAGAQSPRETYLRLLLVESGLPRPRTQISVSTGEGTYYLDMGWREYMVAVEYDGEHHWRDSLQYHNDIRRLETLQRMGWIVIRVVAGDRPAAILRRVRSALDSRRSTVTSGLSV